MTTKQLISTAILLILSQTLFSQPDWQWGISGGSFTSITNDEEVESITTNPQGNVFFIASVGHSNLTLDGIPQDFQGNNNTINQLIGSFDCEGNYRWARTIGGGMG